MKSRPLTALVAALLCAVLAFMLREIAAGALPVDYDEPIYLNAAQSYVRGVRSGDWSVLRMDAVPEHPQLGKLVFGAALLGVPEAPAVPLAPNVEVPAVVLRAGRFVSVVGGALHAALLAVVDPLAGLLLALHSGHGKYTALVMLEALPGLMATLCVFAWRRSRGRTGRWLALSAASLGLTVAGKYLYGIVALAVLVDAAVHARRAPRWLLRLAVWGVLAFAVFLLASPYLWSDPFGRLYDSLLFHLHNSSAAERAVNTTKFVWWQPLGWLGASAPRNDVALPLRLDAAIAVLAALGLPALWRRRRVWALWLAFGLCFLLVYPNRWPQYALIVAAPMCMAAGAALRELRRALRVRRLPKAWPAALLLGAACGAGVVQLADDPYNADPSYRQATRAVQAGMAPDEIAFSVFADPAVRASVLEPGWRSWNALPTAQLGTRNGMLNYDAAAALLNRAAGRHGVWLLTYQRSFADPADTLETLLQRQAPTNGPSEVVPFERGYALVHYRFGAGYEPIPVPAPRGVMQADRTSGAPSALQIDGCAQLRSTRVGADGGTLEVVCFWRSVPYGKLPWDTRVRVVLRDGAGRIVAQDAPLIARSGFPFFRYEDVITGVYLLTLPPGTASGRYELQLQPTTPDGDVAPGVRVVVELLG